MDYFTLLHEALTRNSKKDMIYFIKKSREAHEDKRRALKAKLRKYLAKMGDKNLKESKQSAPSHKRSSLPLKPLERAGLPKQPQPVIRKGKANYSGDSLKLQKRIEENAMKEQKRLEQFMKKMLKAVPSEKGAMLPITAHNPLQDVIPKQYAPTHRKPKECPRGEEKSLAIQQLQQHGNKRKQPVIGSEKLSDGSDKSHFSEAGPSSCAMNKSKRDYTNCNSDSIVQSVQKLREETVTKKTDTLKDIEDSQHDELARKMDSLLLDTVLVQKNKRCRK